MHIFFLFPSKSPHKSHLCFLWLGMDLLSTQAAQGRAFIDVFNTTAQDQPHDHVPSYTLYYICSLPFEHIRLKKKQTKLIRNWMAHMFSSNVLVIEGSVDFGTCSWFWYMSYNADVQPEIQIKSLIQLGASFLHSSVQTQRNNVKVHGVASHGNHTDQLLSIWFSAINFTCIHNSSILSHVREQSTTKTAVLYIGLGCE